MSSTAPDTAEVDAEIAALEGQLAEARARKMALLFAQAWEQVMGYLPTFGGARQPAPAPAPPDAEAKRQHTCRRCGLPGHYSKTCARQVEDQTTASLPEPTADRQPKRCGACGRQGHNARTCGTRPDDAPADDSEPPGPPPTPAEADSAAAYLPLVHRIAARLAKRLPAHVPLADLVSAGTEGLVEAMQRFDPARGVAFKAFASWRIRGAIRDDLRRKDTLSRDMRAWSNRIREAERRLAGPLGRSPTHEELARELGLTPDELHDRSRKLDGQTVIGMDDAGPDFLDRMGADAAREGADGPFAALPRRAEPPGDRRHPRGDRVARLPDQRRCAGRAAADRGPGSRGDVRGLTPAMVTASC